MKNYLKAAALACTFLAAGAVQAAPFNFVYQSTVGSSLSGFFDAGDAVVLTVEVDNGSASGLSQIYTDQDIVQTTLNIGSYQSVWGAGTFYTSGGNTGVTRLTTDAVGSVLNTDSFFGAFTFNGVDNFGTTAYLFNGAVGKSDGTNHFFDGAFSAEANWTFSAVTAPAVPLPASLPMLAVALGGAAFVARRRKAA